MRWAEPVLAVQDLRRSLEFYERVLGLEVVRDFGSHAALTGGLALQSLESWADFWIKLPRTFGQAVLAARSTMRRRILTTS